MRRQHLTLQTKLQEKDAEISRLINQVLLLFIFLLQLLFILKIFLGMVHFDFQAAHRPTLYNNENELENRVRHLTENLIQKQTVIEALQTDKQSLSLQLERMEVSFRDSNNESESEYYCGP